LPTVANNQNSVEFRHRTAPRATVSAREEPKRQTRAVRASVRPAFCNSADSIDPFISRSHYSYDAGIPNQRNLLERRLWQSATTESNLQLRARATELASSLLEVERGREGDPTNQIETRPAFETNTVRHIPYSAIRVAYSRSTGGRGRQISSGDRQLR
jgi:hypothetical protein